MTDQVRRLELVILDLIAHGRARCGDGFGKYPLGIRDAVEALLPLINPSDPAAESITTAWAAFQERLAQ